MRLIAALSALTGMIFSNAHADQVTKLPQVTPVVAAESNCALLFPTDRFQAAKCILQLACGSCSAELKREDLRIGFEQNVVTRITPHGSKSAKFGPFEVRGGFAVSVVEGRHGATVCPLQQSQVYMRGIALEGCFSLLDGRPMPVDLPYPLNEPRFVKSIIVTGLQKNPADFNRLATGVVVLQKKMSICGVGLPAKTELSFSSMIKEMELEATPPNGSVVHGKRFPLPEEKLMLTDGTKCSVRFENRAMDE